MTLPYRPNVCIILRKGDKYLLGERLGCPGVWQFPQGGVEPEYTLEENVLRELEEELGAPQDRFRIVKKLKLTHRYDFESPPQYAVGKWRGQEQSFWLVDFLGNDSDIQLDWGEPEFDSYRWCALDEILIYAEEKRRKGYEGVVRELKNDE